MTKSTQEERRPDHEGRADTKKAQTQDKKTNVSHGAGVTTRRRTLATEPATYATPHRPTARQSANQPRTRARPRHQSRDHPKVPPEGTHPRVALSDKKAPLPTPPQNTTAHQRHSHWLLTPPLAPHFRTRSFRNHPPHTPTPLLETYRGCTPPRRRCTQHTSQTSGWPGIQCTGP